MKVFLSALATGVAVLMAGCANHDEPIGQGFGESVRHNMSMHIINPSPDYADTSPSGLSGPRAAGAIHRYETGKVEDLKVEKTSRKAMVK